MRLGELEKWRARRELEAWRVGELEKWRACGCVNEDGGIHPCVCVLCVCACVFSAWLVREPLELPTAL